VDQVVSLCLFMPILRDELKSFISTHNAHKIGVQPKRSHRVADVPDELYHGAWYTLMFKTPVGQAYNDVPLNTSINPFSSTIIPQWLRGRRWPSLMYNQFAVPLSQKLPPLLSIAEFTVASASELVARMKLTYYSYDEGGAVARPR
jgi:hypothetical protein